MTITDLLTDFSARRCQAFLEDLAGNHPAMTLETIATTPFGRPVTAAVLGNGPRRVLFTAAHHGNEWITAPILLAYAQALAQGDGDISGHPAREILTRATIHFVPLVNPDGVDLVTGAIAPGEPAYELARGLGAGYPQIPFPQGWKANLMGVDLNLQYPAQWERAREIKFSQGYTRPGPRDYVGRGPLTQRESRGLAEYTRRVDPALVLAYHTQGRVIYWQFGEDPVSGARALGDAFAAASGYALADTPYASSFAGYKDWFIQDFRRPGYTIEAGLGENPLPISQFPQIYRENQGILTLAALGLPPD